MAHTKRMVKNIFRKTVDGKKVLRDRTKAGLAVAGGTLLFTPLGGNILSSAAGNAAGNTTKIAGALHEGVTGNMSSQLSSSSSSLLLVMLGILLVVGQRMV